MPIPPDEYFCRIQAAVAAESERCGVSAVNLILDMAVASTQLRNGWIRQQIKDARGEKKEKLYRDYMIMFGLSESMIIKISRGEK